MAVASALALGTSGLGMNSYALTNITSPLTVTATVAANCTINTTALVFGTYDAIGPNAANALNGSGGEVIVTCTMGTIPTVTLDQGINPKSSSSAAFPERQMSGPNGSRLAYALFSDAARSNAWGSAGVSYTSNGTPKTLQVWGSVDSGQNVPAGVYSDTVVATVIF